MNQELTSEDFVNAQGRDSAQSLKPSRSASGKMNVRTLHMRKSESRGSVSSSDEPEAQYKESTGKRARDKQFMSISADRKKSGGKRKTLNRNNSNMSKTSVRSSDKNKNDENPKSYQSRQRKSGI